MKRRFLVLVASSLLLGLGAGPAVADEPTAQQTAGQLAVNGQTANSDAKSVQVQPSNTNISVRVLSPGDGGRVWQDNTSSADSFAGNFNSTEQTANQTQSGAGSGTAVQDAGQKNVNLQDAVSNAESKQIKPSNTNISVRVLSPGDDGDVKQSNRSSADSKAINVNKTKQDLTQDQSPSCGCRPEKKREPADGYGERQDGHGDYGDSADSAAAIQAAGQLALNKQTADSSAKSVQIKPSNKNISVRVLSDGDDGDVWQTNDSSADSKALNKNQTDQTLDQTQSGSCGCSKHGKGDGMTAIQAAAQAAFNFQHADSNAESKQIEPENKAFSLRIKSGEKSDDHGDGGDPYRSSRDDHGKGGDLFQGNRSSADSFAFNWNDLDQTLSQGPREA
jgi:hypothetical protein